MRFEDESSDGTEQTLFDSVQDGSGRRPGRRCSALSESCGKTKLAIVVGRLVIRITVVVFQTKRGLADVLSVA